MENIMITSVIAFAAVGIVFVIAFLISNIVDCFDSKRVKKQLEEATRRMPMRIIHTTDTQQIESLKDKLRSAERQLSIYRTEYAKRMQEQLNNKEKYCKEEPIQGVYCRECKNNVSSIACKANVKCKLYEKK